MYLKDFLVIAASEFLSILQMSSGMKIVFFLCLFRRFKFIIVIFQGYVERNSKLGLKQ